MGMVWRALLAIGAVSARGRMAAVTTVMASVQLTASAVERPGELEPIGLALRLGDTALAGAGVGCGSGSAVMLRDCSDGIDVGVSGMIRRRWHGSTQARDFAALVSE